MKIDPSSKIAHILDTTWITCLIINTAWAYLTHHTSHSLTRHFVAALLLGVTTIFSKKIKNFSRVGKVLYWIASNIMKPQTKYNHIIWGFFAIFIIGLSAVLGYEPRTAEEIHFFKELHRSPEYWIGIVLVLAFNITVGVHTANRSKNKKN